MNEENQTRRIDVLAIGLFGLAVGALTLGVAQLGWIQHKNMVGALVIALIFGGIVQLLAGITDIRYNEQLGGTALTMYGFLWIPLHRQTGEREFNLSVRRGTLRADQSGLRGLFLRDDFSHGLPQSDLERAARHHYPDLPGDDLCAPGFHQRVIARVGPYRCRLDGLLSRRRQPDPGLHGEIHPAARSAVALPSPETSAFDRQGSVRSRL